VDEKKRLEEEVKKEDSLVNQLKSLKDEIEATKRKLPDKEDVSALIVKIAEVAQKTGCLANSLTQQPTGAAAGPLGLSVSQEIWKTRWKADFMSFSLLVNKIEEHFERFIAFENLMITPTNSGMVAMGTKDGQEEISVDVVTYCYKGQ
jgi:Tfp pilus assembly protein PilO